MSRDSSVSKVSGYELDDQNSIPGRTQDDFFFATMSILALGPNGNWGSFGQSVKLITHPHLTSRFRMHGALPLHQLCILHVYRWHNEMGPRVQVSPYQQRPVLQNYPLSILCVMCQKQVERRGPVIALAQGPTSFKACHYFTPSISINEQCFGTRTTQTNCKKWQASGIDLQLSQM
jgi:hypothetical protein